MSDPDIKELFLDKVVWLCRESPDIGSGSLIGRWLVYCIQKGTNDASLQAKREAVDIVLRFFGLLQRKEFEAHLINYVRTFSLTSSRRDRRCSSRIENGTDWARTFQKALVESGGRMCSFVNYSRSADLDCAARSSLVLLAWDMGCELRQFADQIKDFDPETASVFRCRADALTALRKNGERLAGHYYSERTEYVLMRTPEGRRLADEIAAWFFMPQRICSSEKDKPRIRTAAKLLSDRIDGNRVNDNDLFEVVATVFGIQTLCEMGFKISRCSIDDTRKPVVELRKDKIRCRVQKSFEASEATDDLIDFRRVNNAPTGLQPDIVYRFWSEDCADPPLFLIGDAKNYGRESGKINYPIALYAMMHYLIAYHGALGLKIEDVMPFLQCQVPDNSPGYQRIVLFFSNGDKSGTPQPGPQGKTHPVLFVYAGGLQDDSQREKLKNFFDKALEALRDRGAPVAEAVLKAAGK